MTFDDYQKKAKTFARYPDIGNNLVYAVLGIVSESGEIAGKLKKVIRDDNYELTDEKRAAMIDELGDVLWYVSTLCSELKIPMEELAQMNVAKLTDRKKRDKLRGSGDTR